MTPIGEGSRTKEIDFTIMRTPERGHDWNPIYIGQSDASRSMLTSGLNGPEGTGLACALNLAGFAPAGN